MSANKIAIYCDDGTANVEVLEASLRQALDELQLQDRFTIDNITAHQVIHDHWSLSSAKLFIMPGGRDLPYVEKLASEGNDRIRQFVKQGGRYLGLCAGAYFASNKIEFEKDTNMEVCGERELKFYHGLAKGCVFPGFKYNDNSGARIVPIRLHEGISSLVDMKQCWTYYNGGCEFIALKDSINIGEEEILASYASNDDRNESSIGSNAPPIAIVKCKIGSGMAILSGVHPEYSAKFLDVDKYNDKLLQQLYQHEADRALLFRELLSMLLM